MLLQDLPTVVEHLNINIVCGVVSAVFAVLVDTRLAATGLRDYLAILSIAILATATVIEHWFLSNTVITSCTVGFCIGFLADDVYRNLKTTMPEFVKQIVDDVLHWAKNWVKRILGAKTDD